MSFHDEPLVVENGPLGMDIGQSHADIVGLFAPVAGTDNWLRKASDPTRILVLVKKPNGDVEDFKTTSLDTHAGAVKFTLEVPGDPDPAVPTLTLEWGGLTRDELTIKPDRVKFTRDGRRLKPSRAARIAKVEWSIDDKTTDFIDLKDGGNLRHQDVFVALF
jgi:hypothetical protein